MKFSISVFLPRKAFNLNNPGDASRRFVQRGPLCKVCFRSDELSQIAETCARACDYLGFASIVQNRIR
jgi:hypothetical protein